METKEIKINCSGEKAFEIAIKDRTVENLLCAHRPSYYDGLLQGAIEMAEWKDDQFKECLQRLSEEIQSNLYASSGYNDEYSRGYQDCGSSILKMIESINIV